MGGLGTHLAFGFLGILFFFFGQELSHFLCTRFCLNHVQIILQKKKKKKKKRKRCAFVSWPEPCCVTVLALPQSKV